MHVLIATPTTGHMVSSAYVHSLVGATQAFNAAGWQYQHLVFNGTDVELARNYMASELLKDEYLSHILFLDTDMLVEQAVFDRLIKADQATYLGPDNIVFGISVDGDARAYPKRILAWHAWMMPALAPPTQAGPTFLEPTPII